MSATTLQTHWGKHHAAYVTKLNALLPGTGLEDSPLETIIRQSTPDTPLFNNAAQVYNHNFYWQSMTPRKPGNEETLGNGPLMQEINKAWGSLARMQADFSVRLYSSLLFSRMSMLLL